VKDLLLVVPSRGRPQNIARLLEAMDETCRGDTTLVLGLDDDDPELPAYGELLKARGVLGKDTEIRGGLHQVVAWVNQLAVPRAPEYRFTGHIGDDNVPRTAGWDTAIMEALGETPFAFGNDLYPREPGTLCCHVFMRSEVIAKLGYFAPRSIRHMYCVAPDTPVLTADLRWVPAGKIGAGDELVGVDEYPLSGRHKRAFRRASVSEVSRRIAESVRVELEDGREVTCSTDHKWLAVRRWMGTGASGTGRFEWRDSASLLTGDQIVSPLRVWNEETSFEAGWLSGIFDGEGTAGRWGSLYPCARLAVAQNPGPVLDRIIAGLGAMDIGYKTGKKRYYAGRDGVVVLDITPRSACIELLGRLQTTRLRSEKLWEDMGIMARDSASARAVVANVRSVGATEVVSIATSTGTFLANGLVAHNCDVAWMAWGKACGIAYLDDVIIEHLHYTVGKAPCDESYARSTALITGGDLDAWHAYSGDDGPAGLNADIAKLGGIPFSVQSLRDFNAALNIPDRW
jgi:hypothetical protein